MIVNERYSLAGGITIPKLGLGTWFIRTCGRPREDLFVASKVAAEEKSYEAAARSIDETLRKTGLSYLDQMIIHSPQPWREFRTDKRYFEENKEVWRALEDAQTALDADPENQDLITARDNAQANVDALTAIVDAAAQDGTEE